MDVDVRKTHHLLFHMLNRAREEVLDNLVVLSRNALELG